MNAAAALLEFGFGTFSGGERGRNTGLLDTWAENEEGGQICALKCTGGFHVQFVSSSAGGEPKVEQCR